MTVSPAVGNLGDLGHEEIFTPLAPAMLADPYAVYQRLRRSDPAHWHDQLGAWVLTRHADCVHVLKHPEVFSSDPRKLGKPIPESVLSLQTMDPPEQSIVRRHFLSAFRRRDLDAWSAHLHRIAGELLTHAGDKPFDFVSDIAEPLALHAMCLLYDVPFPADDKPLRTASRTMILGMDSGLDPARRAPALAAREVLNSQVGEWLANSPRLTPLAGLDQVGSIDRQYLINSLRAVFDAGFSTTANLLGNAMKHLIARGPLATADLRRLDARAVDELARLDGAVQAVSRHCLTGGRLGEREFRRGDVVIVMLGAANHDPAVFARPAEADFGRDPNPHLGFGRGVHACLGGHLATRVTLALFGALATHRERIERAGEPVQRPTATQRGLDSLPLVAG